LKEVDIEKSTLDDYKKQIRHDNLQLTEKIDRLDFEKRELFSKANSL